MWGLREQIKELRAALEAVLDTTIGVDLVETADDAVRRIAQIARKALDKRGGT